MLGYILYFITWFIPTHQLREYWWRVLELSGMLKRVDDYNFMRLQLCVISHERYLDPREGGGLNSITQWYRFHGDLNRVAELSDKFAVRKYVRDCIGEKYLTRLFPDNNSYWTDPAEIDFDRLPKSFVLKLNNGSGMNLLVPDKGNLDLPLVQEKLSKWLEFDPSAGMYREHQYELIANKIICEELLPMKGEKSPDDYKVMCTDGKPLFVWVDRGRFGKHTRTFFDLEWCTLDVCFESYPHLTDKEIPRPDNLKEILEVAGNLSIGFPLVRVDFYDIEGRIVFGEMTFTSAGGVGRYTPLSFSRQMAQKVDIAKFVDKWE